MLIFHPVVISNDTLVVKVILIEKGGNLTIIGRMLRNQLTQSWDQKVGLASRYICGLKANSEVLGLAILINMTALVMQCCYNRIERFIISYERVAVSRRTRTENAKMASF